MKTLFLPAGRVKRDVLVNSTPVTVLSSVKKTTHGRHRTPLASVDCSDYFPKEKSRGSSQVLWASKVLATGRGRCVAIKLNPGLQVQVGLMDLKGKMLWVGAEHLVLEPGFKAWRLANKWTQKPV